MWMCVIWSNQGYLDGSRCAGFPSVVIESFHRSRFVFFFLFFFRKWFRRHRLFSPRAYDGRRPTAATRLDVFNVVADVIRVAAAAAPVVIFIFILGRSVIHGEDNQNGHD